MQKGKYIDISGQRFGNLVVIKRSGEIGGRSKWLCRCDCGKEAVVSVSNLRNGHTKSCGCLVSTTAIKTRTKHGHKKKAKVNRLYPVWRNMKQRCDLPTHKYYKSYGGRGITVCQEWRDYDNFRKWAYANGYDEDAPRGSCTIDRIDVDGNYEPSNCRWVSMDVQAKNKRNSKNKEERNDDLLEFQF